MTSYRIVVHLVRTGVVLIALILSLSAESAYAETTDFEDVAVAPHANVWGGDLVSRGLFFDSLGDHTHLDRDDFRVANNSTYLATDDATGNNPLIMYPVGKTPFTLSQLDLAEWVDENRTARTVTITGHYYSGGTIVRNVGLDLIFDGVGGQPDFQTIVFSSPWTNLQSVWLKGTGALNTVGGNNYFALDNIVYTTVPEPTGAALALVCGLSFWLLRTR